MKFKRLIISAIFLAIIPEIYLFSQNAVNTAFQSGESLKFKGSYYMSSLWADLAEVKIDVADLNSGVNHFIWSQPLQVPIQTMIHFLR
ncbi:MAG: hypothetical protein IPN68_19125 [Bacteroidetes bacterium]|nr:hypothetical protein [Bacteroidota bacterium]